MKSQPRFDIQAHADTMDRLTLTIRRQSRRCRQFPARAARERRERCRRSVLSVLGREMECLLYQTLPAEPQPCSPHPLSARIT